MVSVCLSDAYDRPALILVRCGGPKVASPAEREPLAMGCSGLALELPQGDPGGFVTGFSRGSGELTGRVGRGSAACRLVCRVMAWVPGRPDWGPELASQRVVGRALDPVSQAGASGEAQNRLPPLPCC